MVQVRLADQIDFPGWRAAARALLAAGVPPGRVRWAVGHTGASLLAGEWLGVGGTPLSALPPLAEGEVRLSVPRAFLRLARLVVLHRDPGRFGLLYGILWRLTHGERRLLGMFHEPKVHRAVCLARDVGRDIHAMRMFLRFREVPGGDDGVRHVAWFEPAHRVLEAAAPFFVRRFAGQLWTILTPERSVRWDGARLNFGPGGRRADLPPADVVETGWKTFYAATFNPQRVSPKTMQGHMPKKYWPQLPEAECLPALLGSGPAEAGKH